MSQIHDLRDPFWNMPERGLQSPPTVVGIPSETPRALNLKTEVQLEIPLQSGTLGVRENTKDQFPAFLTVENPF
jgi:hypothetical protein